MATGTGQQRTDQPAVVLRADGVEKSYHSPLPFVDSTTVLTGASLEIRAGEIVGIIGGNGAGKSTLLKVIVGMLEKDGGTIERRGTVGWCPQETRLYDRLTVRETFRLFGRGYGLPDEQTTARMREFADALDFEEYLDTRVDRLSGGNRQKVNLSVSLLHDPDLLLLDEPYTGFDWDTYLSFWELSESLTESGTAIGIISHLIEERDRFDRIYELEAGRLQPQR